MFSRIHRFYDAIVMQPAVPAYDRQNNGLTLPYTFSND